MIPSFQNCNKTWSFCVNLLKSVVLYKLFSYFCSAMEYEELWHRLTHIYDAGEAKAIVRWVLDVLVVDRYSLRQSYGIIRT